MSLLLGQTPARALKESQIVPQPGTVNTSKLHLPNLQYMCKDLIHLKQNYRGGVRNTKLLALSIKTDTCMHGDKDTTKTVTDRQKG